jgi:hypothetical protein
LEGADAVVMIMPEGVGERRHATKYSTAL